jgi:DNA-binding MarR family transcriptional regulator
MTQSANATMTHQELTQALNQALRDASTATVLIHTVLAESFGLNVSDWKCGELVSRHGALTAGQLAEMTGLTTGTITGIIDRLENARFVRRVSDAKDRRKVWVEATNERNAEIHQRLDAAFGPVLAWMNEYSDEQLAFLLAFTQRSTELTLESAACLRRQVTARL